jgi:hypothetical protein
MYRLSYRGEPLLPAGPLGAWLRSQPRTDLELEQLSGVPARTIYAFRSGERASVSLDVADRITLYATGSPALLHELYPCEPEQLTLAHAA